VLQENLKCFFQLYYRPRAAMTGILDHGSWLFAAIAVVLVTGLSQTGTLVSFYSRAFRDTLPEEATVQPADPADPEGSLTALDVDDPETLYSPRPGPYFLYSALFSVSGFMIVPALACLYVPAIMFLISHLQGRGSFSFLLRREYGGLLACGLMAWAAAHLPFALLGLGASLGAPSLFRTLALLLAPKIYFTALMAIALSVVFNAGSFSSAAVAATSWVSMILSPFLFYLASPCLLYYFYAYYGGDLHALGSAFRSRQSYRRYLEACTINPNDADAHVQLGLIHLERRQYAEAVKRFETALEIRPEELEANFHLGRVAREQGRLEDAVRHLSFVAERDEKYSQHEVWRELGAAHLAASRHVEALRALERFVRARPYEPEGLYLMGGLLLTRGETDRAREQFETCIESVRTMPSYRRAETRGWGKLAEKALARLKAKK